MSISDPPIRMCRYPVQTTLKISLAMKAALAAMARDRRQPESDLVREILSAALDRPKVNRTTGAMKTSEVPRG